MSNVGAFFKKCGCACLCPVQEQKDLSSKDCICAESPRQTKDVPCSGSLTAEIVLERVATSSVPSAYAASSMIIKSNYVTLVQSRVSAAPKLEKKLFAVSELGFHSSCRHVQVVPPFCSG